MLLSLRAHCHPISSPCAWGGWETGQRGFAKGTGGRTCGGLPLAELAQGCSQHVLSKQSWHCPPTPVGVEGSGFSLPAPHVEPSPGEPAQGSCPLSYTQVLLLLGAPQIEPHGERLALPTPCAVGGCACLNVCLSESVSGAGQLFLGHSWHSARAHNIRGPRKCLMLFKI